MNKQARCCAGMEKAACGGYVHVPISYTKDKQVIFLRPILTRRGQPGFVLNFCPWCGIPLRSVYTESEGT